MKRTINLFRTSEFDDWKGDGYKLSLDNKILSKSETSPGKSYMDIIKLKDAATNKSDMKPEMINLVEIDGSPIANDSKDGFECKIYNNSKNSYQYTLFFDSAGKCTGGKYFMMNDPRAAADFYKKQPRPPIGRYPTQQPSKKPQSESQQPAAKKEQPTTQGEIVAFFANPEWVLAKGSGEKVGKILKGEEAFIGAWPAPKVFCKKLVAKKNNGDAVEGQIKFYTDSGLYVGDIEFSKNGQGINALPPKNVKFNEETLNAINFREAFLSESSKSKNSEWNTLTSVSAICREILEEPDFTTRLKNHLNLSKKVLNSKGLSYLSDTMKITLPERYEVEAACLVYLNFLNNNKSDTNENDDPNTVSFERAENSAWYAFDNGGNPYYTIRIEGSDSEVAASDYVIYKMIQDKLIKVYKIDKYALINPGAGSHKFEFVGTVEAKCGLTIEINDEGEVTKSTCKFDNDDAGYKAFYDKAKLVLGEEEFKKQIIGSSGSMSSIALVDKIAEILKSKNLDPTSREYGKFAEAIEEYIKEGKNGTQKEKSAQPDGESKSSPSDASAQVSGQKEIIFKKPIYAMTWYSDPNFDKQIAVQYHSSSGNKGSREDINYALLYRMVKDKIVKLYDKGGKTISATCRIKSNDNKDFGTITFNNGDVSSHTLKPPTDDEGYKGKFYDSVKKLLGDKVFEKKLVDYDGNLHYMAKNMKIISDILKNAGEDPNLYNYGKFADVIEEYIKDKETLENAKNEALSDLYDRSGQTLPGGMTIEEFDATDFAKKFLNLKSKTLSKVEKKLEALEGDGEKQIELLTRLLMRMKRKKDFEKKHKFGKIRYALGEREKTDPKIKKCFEAAGKYIVKNYDKMTESTLSRMFVDLKNIFKDHVGEPWADNLRGNLEMEIVRKCWIARNYEGPRKAIMGIIFASMAGINDPKDLICACDALKKGGIKNSDQKTFLGQASQIRKSIKALCGRDGTTYATRKAVIKKLLVNDYKFIDGSHCNELFPPEPKQSK